MHVLSSVFLLGIALVCGAANAQGEMASDPGVRRIELAADGARTSVDVLVSPGLSTVLLFDSELAQEGTEIEGRELFSFVDVGKATIRLELSPLATPRERLRLAVRFRDGSAPIGASFSLIVHPAKAENLVAVYRNKRTVESYQQEAREMREEAIRCREANARMAAEHEAPGGLAGLLATSLMNELGVAGKTLTKQIPADSKSALKPSQLRSYRSKNRVAVEVLLEDTRGGQPWSASGAALRAQSGIELKVLRVWQKAPITSNAAGRVIVEAEAPANASQGTFSLKLWEADGPRTVTISNVTFP